VLFRSILFVIVCARSNVMPIEWDLKQQLAVKHQIYRPSELQGAA